MIFKIFNLFLNRGGAIILLISHFAALESSFAQSALFSPYTLAQAQLSPEEMSRYNLLNNPSVSYSVSIISTGDVRSLAENGILKFLMPGNPDTLIAEATQITDDAEHGFVWSGVLLNEMGHVCFNYRNGRTFGFVMKSDGVYDISPINNNRQFLVHRVAQAGSCGIPPEMTPPPNITVEPDPPTCNGFLAEDSNCPAIISILVIATPDAKAYVEQNFSITLNEFGQNGENQINMAFYNSNILNKTVRVKVIEKGGFTFNGDPFIDIEALKLWSNSERNLHNADVVFLLTKDFYTGPFGSGLFGFASLPESQDQLVLSNGFGIIAATAFYGLGNFPHEFGHILGCRHNWPWDGGDDDTPICAHGMQKIYYTPPFDGELIGTADIRRTLVTNGLPTLPFIIEDEQGNLYDATATWVLHYSNPDVTVGNFLTGRAEDPVANNARQIRGTACTVANYFPTQELAAFPGATSQPCDLKTPVTFSANITPPTTGIPGVGPYSVTWYWNSSGYFAYDNSNAELMGTGTTLTIPSHKDCPYYWVKCVITSSDGITINRIFRVKLDPVCCTLSEPGDDRDNATIKQPLTAYPNPVAAGTVLQLTQACNQYTWIDVHGRILESYDGGSVLSIPVDEKWPTGLLLLRIVQPDGHAQTINMFIIKP
ncbi:MAG: hypothetical protein IT269_09545 [Saprospiraceae bacterium]|nr:hypothetical protein [Saprospiraceae bacterium]